MILNKQKIIDEIIRRLKNKAGFDTNYQELKKLQNEIRRINSKLVKVTKELKEIKDARIQKKESK
tara:strand:+ start:545 stop:739 length:195 start_codon:yes stop_codon:yes gene_type:complete